MSDLAAVLGGIWFVMVGLVWTFVVFMPAFKRMRAGPTPREPAIKDQLRLIALIVACSAAYVAVIWGLALWSAVIALLVAPLLFYGGMTAFLRHLEKSRDQSKEDGARYAASGST